MNGTQSNETFGRRAARTLTRIAVAVLLVGLLGAVGFLLAQLNARTYRLEARSGELTILKGKPLPFGADPYRPSDPMLADTYAPIPLAGVDPGALLERRFTDRDELDRELFNLLEKLARPRVTASDAGSLQRGLYYVRRAERLRGMTEGQRETLEGLQSEVAFYQARTKLDDARRLVVEGLAQLELAAESTGQRSETARRLIATLTPRVRALEQALKQSLPGAGVADSKWGAGPGEPTTAWDDEPSSLPSATGSGVEDGASGPREGALPTGEVDRLEGGDADRDLPTAEPADDARDGESGAPSPGPSQPSQRAGSGRTLP